MRDQKGANRVTFVRHLTWKATVDDLRRIRENRLASGAVFRGGGKKEEEEEAVPGATKRAWRAHVGTRGAGHLEKPVLLIIKQLRLEIS